MKKRVVTLRYSRLSDALNNLLSKAFNSNVRTVDIRRTKTDMEIWFSSYSNPLATSHHGIILHRIPLIDSCPKCAYSQLCFSVDSSTQLHRGKYLNPQQMNNSYGFNPFWKVESKKGRFGTNYRLSLDVRVIPITDNFQS
ncbi:MAG: hypothetical protein Q8L27_00130 [archaeon]|nr:hypothetical protein [archaeon]